MEQALPVAVRFLQQGNCELSRNLSSYLSLAAIDHAKLLAAHVHLVLDSIVIHSRSRVVFVRQVCVDGKFSRQEFLRLYTVNY